MVSVKIEPDNEQRLTVTESRTTRRGVKLPLEYRRAYIYAFNVLSKLKESELTNPTLDGVILNVEGYLEEVAVRHLDSFSGVMQVPATQADSYQRNRCRLIMARVLSELVGVCGALGMEEEHNQLFQFRHEIMYRLSETLGGKR